MSGNIRITAELDVTLTYEECAGGADASKEEALGAVERAVKKYGVADFLRNWNLTQDMDLTVEAE
jgi:hypothetical protein